MSKALVVLSGGQDSTTCLFWAKAHFDEVEAVTFNYGQRHRVEIQSAIKVAELAGVKHEIVDVGPILAGSSPLVSGNTLETYASADVLPGGLEKTFVPGRNAMFAVLAANRAYAARANAVVLGVSQEDYGGYPDCRIEFIRAMEAALNLGLRYDDADEFKLTIETPVIYLDKKHTVELAMSLPGCMEALAYSHTCYAGQVPPCGSCHACLLRERGFALAGVQDPLVARLAA